MPTTHGATDHPASYYAATAIDMPEFPVLQGEQHCDVCVIGAGFSGLSAALHLAERGYKVILLEGRRVGWGASGRNGGQIGTGQRADQDDLESREGQEQARLLWDMFKEARQLLRDQVTRHHIDCELTPGGLTAAYKSEDASWCERYVDKLHRDYSEHDIRYVGKPEIGEMLGSERFYGGMLDPHAGHIHPLNYALGLARAAQAAGVQIFENTLVQGYDQQAPTNIRTAKGSVRADFVVLACNGYIDGIEPRVAGKIMPINNFMLATEPLGQARARSLIRDNVSVHDTKFVVDYWRLSSDHRLLFGGGENYTTRFPDDIKNFVRKYMLRVYPQLSDVHIDYGWGGTLAITMTRMPHFARLQPNVFCAQGFSGHGVAMTGLAGKLIAEAVAGTAERFDVFAGVKTPSFPGGTLLRWPGLVAGMLYHSLRDRM